jgi:hypothetical protein
MTQVMYVNECNRFFFILEITFLFNYLTINRMIIMLYKIFILEVQKP